MLTFHNDVDNHINNNIDDVDDNDVDADDADEWWRHQVVHLFSTHLISKLINPPNIFCGPAQDVDDETTVIWTTLRTAT